LNTTIYGKVAPGNYTGIVFVNGVPESLNHAGPAESAIPPLDDMTMFWNWLGGYRFIVAELAPVASDGGVGDGGEPLTPSFVHVGSTGCTGSAASGYVCARKARNQVRLMGFNTATSVVVADLAAVFRNSDLRSAPECHSVAENCRAPYAALGVNMDTGAALDQQQVFRLE
jgi:uncharacterized repeat protein (TIGR04052 family)